MTTFSNEAFRRLAKPLIGFAAFLAVFALVITALISPAATVDAQEKGSRGNGFNNGPESALVEVCNSAPIAIPDQGPATPYPAPLVVSGMTGTITDLNVKLVNFSHTFPADIAILLVSPDGRRFVLQSDTGGGADVVNLTYTFDDQAASSIPEDGPLPPNNGSVRPTSIGDDDEMPPPAPPGPYNQPAPAGTATLNGTFGGAMPNGTWNLYVIDFFAGDMGSINGGYCLDITTSAGPTPSPTPTPTPGPTPTASPDAPVDINGDGRTDFTVIRNTGTGASGQATWYTLLSGGNPLAPADWGLASDVFVPADYDGDRRDDLAVWRPAAQGTFYIIQSQTSTIRIENFGTTGDDPTVVADYDGDNRDDIAVYRDGAAAGAQSVWFYRQQSNPNFTRVEWGQNGDSPAPGDYDGDNSSDFVVQRPEGSFGRFFLRLSGGGFGSIVFGGAADSVVPGDYDDDGRTDIAVVRPGPDGILVWDFEPSGTASFTIVRDFWGVAATDIITQGDYDGDGRTEYSVWRPGSPGTFFQMTVGTRNITTRSWGEPNDYPVANYNQH